jgi:hypothetical protein
MSINYTNFDIQTNVFPGYGINYYPSSVRLRDMGGTTSFDYAWGKGIGALSNSGWGSSNTSIYYGNQSISNTTSYDITFKKNLITNEYSYVWTSKNSVINFDSQTNSTRTITQPINDSALNLWNSENTALIGKKITDINFLYLPMRITSLSNNTATMTISNFKINDNTITFQNNQSFSLTSTNGEVIDQNLFIPIQQITGDFNIKFDLTLPVRTTLSASQESSRIWLQFGEATLPSITSTNLSYGYINSGYSQTLTGSGGTVPYSWNITSGTLPQGLSLNSTTGIISGTPIGSAGTNNFTVRLTDSNTTTNDKNLSITIYDELEIGTLSPLINGMVNTQYTLDLDESGGLVPYTWSIIAGLLPNGLTIVPLTGVISGIPTTSGIYNFETQLLDQNNISVTREYTLTINEPVNPICYIGESKVLVQDKQTGVESQVCVKDITPEKYLVYSTTQQKFVGLKKNCISGSTDNFILIKKDLFGENKPSEDFYVTPTHPILYKNCEIYAKKIVGCEKVRLEKQLVYSLVTDNREALAINNIDVICWEYNEFIKSYNSRKRAIWLEKMEGKIILIKK